jgi:thiamine pyrophosphate-dependent acetolactate synthase large subunit-like protein
MTQQDFISRLSVNRDIVIIGSLGTISNDLDKIDHPHKICVRGAMGCVLGFALGYALNTDKMVVCLIGDGALLMKAGSIATINRYNLKNLKIIVLNNNCYKSCGGQETNYRFLKRNWDEVICQ